jgi:hypothetical protein
MESVFQAILAIFFKKLSILTQKGCFYPHTGTLKSQSLREK